MACNPSSKGPQTGSRDSGTKLPLSKHCKLLKQRRERTLKLVTHKRRGSPVTFELKAHWGYLVSQILLLAAHTMQADRLQRMEVQAPLERAVMAKRGLASRRYRRIAR